MSEPRKGLNSRLIRVFALQATLVSVATTLGVWAAYAITEQYLVRQALTTEADYFLEQRAARPGFPVPETRNMKGYLIGSAASEGVSDDTADTIPTPLKALPGDYFGRVQLPDGEPIVMVRELTDGRRLILVFKEQQVTRLALLFGVAPLTIVLILIYTASWFTFRQSQALISPVVSLARLISRADVTDGKTLKARIEALKGEDADVDALADAFLRFLDRLEAFVERERSFTRYASHELRTPLAALRAGLDVMDQGPSGEAKQRLTRRMRSTLDDMQSLITTLLQLTRSREQPETAVTVPVRPLMADVAAQCKAALDDTTTQVELAIDPDLALPLPPTTVRLAATNLLRNACQYGEGWVKVTVDERTLTVEDNGPGLTPEDLRAIGQPFYRGTTRVAGHGLGLALVLALCERHDWRFELRNREAGGARFSVYWS